MSTIKIEDVAYVRFRAPDLGEMRAFLEDFGMVATEATATRLVVRGAGPSPVAHVTELGEPGFVRLVDERATRLRQPIHHAVELARQHAEFVVALQIETGGEVLILAERHRVARYRAERAQEVGNPSRSVHEVFANSRLLFIRDLVTQDGANSLVT